MTDRLKNKVALVTAAGQGIGRAIAEAFIAEGARIIATDIALDKLRGLKAARCDKLDVLSTDDVNAFAVSVNKEFGPLNVLANVAGYVHQGSVLDCAERDWDFSFDLNVKSMHRTIKAFLPAMLKSGAGSIINMSSGVSSIKGLPNRYAYGATKAAVIGLTKAVAADFITKGIRCNAICPGTIVSPSFEERVDTVARLCDLGYAGQMVLSHDTNCHMDTHVGFAARFPDWVFTHISDAVVPALKERGVSDQQIAQMLVDNPKAVFDAQGGY